MMSLLLTLLLLVPSPAGGDDTSRTDGDKGWMLGDGPKRPNLVLVTADTLRRDHTGWSGRWPKSFTPHLDAFAAQATRFSAATTAATATRPAIASLLTGRYPGSHSVLHNASDLGLEQVAFPELLAAAGYVSASFSGNRLLDEAGGFQQGIDESEDFSTYFGSADEKIADRSIAWLEAKGRGSQPFFLWVHFMDPHGPYFSAPQSTVRDVPAADGMPNVELPLGTSNYGRGILPKYQKLKKEMGSDWYRLYYRAEVRWMDRQFGRIVAALDELGLSRKTLLVFTADHGESLGEHGYHFQHGATVYEPTANVPLAFRLPGRIEGGRQVDANVSLVDLFPTLAEGLALPGAPASEGRSLGPLLRGRPDGGSLSFVVSGWGRAKAVAVRRGAFKLMHTPQQESGEKPNGEETGFKLFDLRSDPNELVDASSTHPEIREELESILLAWTAERRKLLEAGTDRPARSTPLPPDLAERLRHLGYIDD